MLNIYHWVNIGIDIFCYFFLLGGSNIDKMFIETVAIIWVSDVYCLVNKNVGIFLYLFVFFNNNNKYNYTFIKSDIQYI